MNQNDIFTSLPTSLSCIILRDWLRLKSVVALDSAYCCKANRTSFEELLQSDEYFVREKVIFPSNSEDLHGMPKFCGKIRCMDLCGVTLSMSTLVAVQ